MERRLSDGRLAQGVAVKGAFAVRVLDTIAADPDDERDIRASGMSSLDYIRANPERFLLEETEVPSKAAMRRTMRALVAEGVRESEPISDVVFLGVGALFVVAGLVVAVVQILDKEGGDASRALVHFVTGIGLIALSQVLSLLKRLNSKIERL